MTADCVIIDANLQTRNTRMIKAKKYKKTTVFLSRSS